MKLQKQIIEDYVQNNLGVNKLAQKYDTSPYTIRKILYSNKISIRKSKSKQSALSDTQKDCIIKLYSSGSPATTIAKEYGVHYTTIYDLLKRNSVSIRSPSIANRKYMVNEQAFQNILQEDQFYWLGFLMADGCIFTNKYSHQLSIVLSKKDQKHLKKFQNFIKDIRPLRFSHKHNSVSLCVSSASMCNDLMSYGVVPRKSLIAKAKKGIENNRHFWRGVIDGDGSFGVYMYKSKPQFKITLCGSLNMCEQFLSFANTTISSKAHPYQRTPNGAYVLSFGGRHNVIKLLSKLYANCSIFLDRKQKLANEILKEHK